VPACCRRPFDLIATDGGLLERPHRTTRVPLSPGERVEIVATFRPGERAVLRSFEPELGIDVFQGRFAGADDTFDLLQIRAGATLARSLEGHCVHPAGRRRGSWSGSPATPIRPCPTCSTAISCAMRTPG
jgi:hypothetical protein